MSQTNTSTNTGAGNTNRNQNTGRGVRGQRGSGGKGRGGSRGNRGNSSIVEYSFDGKMKDDCLSKLAITKSRHQATQYKKIIDALFVLCLDKNYIQIYQ